MEDSSYRQGSFPFIPAIFFNPAISFISVIPVSDIFRSL